MSVVIIGGHDRMVCQYKNICKQYKCRAKVFTHMSADLNKQLGSPDLFVLFTNTVSHKMVKCALDEAKRSNAKVIRCHTSSSDTVSEAHGHGMSVGKYQTYLLLRELDPGITVEDIQGMTMREIYQLIRALA